MKHNIKYICIFIVIFIVCMVGLIFKGINKPKGNTKAIIKQDGKVIREISLPSNSEFLVEDGHGGYNKIKIENDTVSIIEANCPDKVCIDQGKITNGLVPIVCLPHKLTITIQDDDKENEFDAVVGGN